MTDEEPLDSDPSFYEVPNDAEDEALAEDLQAWKDRALENFTAWLDGLDAIPRELEDEEDEPDLFSFFGELVALRNEVRKANRRTAEAFSQWSDMLVQQGETIGQLGRSMVAQSKPESGLDKNSALALLAVNDRLERLTLALKEPAPAKRWFGNDDEWQRRWASLQQALSIISDHSQTLLTRLDFQATPALGKPFDPTSMIAVATLDDPSVPPGTVVEVCVEGFEQGGEVLRLAEVKVTPRK